MNDDTLWLCCGVLRAEVEELHRRDSIGGRLVFLDSMLHMKPERLEAVLTSSLEANGTAARLVLIYGDCCAGMRELGRRFRAGRVAAINCAQLLLGRERYRELMREEAFLLLPEWAERWREAVRDEMGLSEQIAPDLMGENRRALVYLDTGLLPVPRQALAECSAYVGLPWRVETVTLDHLLAGLLRAEATAPARLPGVPAP